jgi:hypothetical protein
MENVKYGKRLIEVKAKNNYCQDFNGKRFYEVNLNYRYKPAGWEGRTDGINFKTFDTFKEAYKYALNEKAGAVKNIEQCIDGVDGYTYPEVRKWEFGK